ncbi:translation initiation factor IF-1 [bacterium]|nr:translation initiation factor IF-1 [candidate division CSSED10-310 bacterium]
MAKDDLIQVEGKVTQVLAGGFYKVETETGHVIMARISGRMRSNQIRIVLGDRVTVGVSPHDPTKGLITYRSK